MIRPFYYEKSKKALNWVQKELDRLSYRVHKPEGSMFLWLWFEDLPISSNKLYECLKDQGVLVVSGQYFFPGLKQDWQHSCECVRLTYSQNDDDVRKGIAIIGRVLKKIYQEKFQVEK